MKMIVCLDDKNGMMFNRRRQSQDRILIANMLELCKNQKLWIAPYSESLFPEGQENIIINFAPIQQAGEGEYCFVETFAGHSLPENMEQLVIYRWNRHYPSDETFPMDLNGCILQETVEFPGSSHEKITREIYRIK